MSTISNDTRITSTSTSTLLSSHGIFLFPTSLAINILTYLPLLDLYTVSLVNAYICGIAKLSFTFLRPVSLKNPSSIDKGILLSYTSKSTYLLKSIVVSSVHNLIGKDVLNSIVVDCPNLERLEILYTRKRIKLRSISSSPVNSNNASINPSPIEFEKDRSNSNKSLIKSRVNSPTTLVSSTPIETDYKVTLQQYSNSYDEKESNSKNTCVFATPRVTRVSSSNNDMFTTPAIKNISSTISSNLATSFATPAVKSFNNQSNLNFTTPLVRSSSPVFIPHTLLKPKAIKKLPKIDLNETFSSSPISGSFASQLEFNVKNNKFLEAATFRLLLEKNPKLNCVTTNEAIISLSKLSSLKKLMFWGCQKKFELSDIDCFVENCLNITDLCFKTGGVSSKTLLYLSKYAKQLTAINIQQFNVSEESLCELISKSSLWKLIEFNQISSITDEGISYFSKNRLRPLEVLSLSHVSNEIDNSVLKSLSTLKYLHTIKLHKNL